MEYTSSIEDLSEVRKKVSVSISSEKFSDEVKKTMDSLAQKVTIKGFRPGKAPQQVLEKMYGERARLEAVDRIINESFQALMKENSFSLVGDPAIEIQNIELGKPLVYTATFNIFPKPELNSYDHFNVSIEKREATDGDVEQVMRNVLRNKATLRKIEDRNSVIEGDVVEGELYIRVEGRDEETRPEPFFAKIGEKRIPEIIEEGIVGMEIDETKEIISSIPADHQNEEMRGKAISYTVKVKSISEEVLPELSDGFVKSLEGPEESVLELRMSIRQKLDKDYEDIEREEVKSKVIEELISGHEFEIPQELIDDEIRTLVIQRGIVQRKNGETVDIEPYREQFRTEALRRVKAAILIDRIAEKESLHAKNEDIEQHLKETAAAYGVGFDEVRKFYAKEGRLVGVFIEMTRRKVLDFLADRATVAYSETAA